MGSIKKLAGETIIYGFSTIFGRLLNWLLLPLYVRTMTQADNGMLTFLYSGIAIFQVILSFGFETGFFRFADTNNLKRVFGTLFTFVTSFSLFFLIVGVSFIDYWTDFFDVGNSSLVLVVLLILVTDAIGNLPFVLLRFQNKALKYAFNRFFQIVIIVSLSFFFLIIYPSNIQYFGWLEYFGIHPENKLLNVFIANFVGSLFIPVLLFRSILKNFGGFDIKIFKTVFNYSLPILIVGIFGMINSNIDKLLLPKLLKSSGSFDSLGIYGANFKIGVLMAIFTQSFRMAFEPFFFKNRGKGDNSIYPVILNYFVAFCMIIFLGVVLNVDLVNIIITDEYSSGNVIIPIVLWAQFFFGVYYSISMWYKVTDKTYYAIYFTIIGSVIVIVGNVLMVPAFGFVGAAFSSFIGYLVMVLLSFYFGQKHYYIPYNLKKLGFLMGLALIVYFISYIVNIENITFRLGFNWLLLLFYIAFVWRNLNGQWKFALNNIKI